MSYLLKNLIIVIILTAVIAAGYYYLFGIKTGDTPSNEEISLELQQKTENLLRDTQTIGNYKFDTQIPEVINDPRFASLEDFRVILPEADPGRENPFLPVQ